MKTKYDKYSAGCASHLFKAFNDREKYINVAIEKLKFYNVQFDVIVCTGCSGIVFASVLAYVMGKELVIVRKGSDRSHSNRKVEGSVKSEHFGKWIFVDDLVDSGKTRKRVKKAIKAWAGEEALKNYVGDYLYDDNSLSFA
jgi:orotate phosphoribosyltransferase-like protein